jgi:4-hydroxy-3-methylbut-2-enyl diphosphate reductase
MNQRPTRQPAGLPSFGSELVDRVRAMGNVLNVPGGSLHLPRVFGLCYGVTRALSMLESAVASHAGAERKIVLLGQIIHNPWVNKWFERRGVRILADADFADLPSKLSRDDVAVIPAFGVAPEVERRLRKIGCGVVDTTCGDVRRLWTWAQREVQAGMGILIFGRASHDETVVTRRRLEEAGGTYLVLGKLDEVRRLGELIERGGDDESLETLSGPPATNAANLRPLLRLAQVSQTTMLYSQTLEVRRILTEAFDRRFGPEAHERLALQPTVCRATQDRQSAAQELCEQGLDLTVVVGGFGSSNTRHLFELAGRYGRAVFIEDAQAIVSERELHTMDSLGRPCVLEDWLPGGGSIRVGVLAGASTPEVLVGQVIDRLTACMG